MLEYYFSPGVNPTKVSLFLEESGIPYRPIAMDLLKGDHHSDAYRRINPNEKVPAIVDDGTPIFDSQAILLYLAEKHDMFLPAPEHRGEFLSWLLFIGSGLGPFSGQAVHFRMFTPEPYEYPTQRYNFEAVRHWRLLEARLEGRQWLMGDTYTILDMAAWGWLRYWERVLDDEVRSGLPNLNRLLEAINARPAAQRALGLIDDHDFTMTFDEEAMNNLFRHRLASPSGQ